MTETRALLLTDVVDSTKLSERLGDSAMAELWSAHDRVARDLLPLWRGREIDKTDGMLLMFERVADAVAYALAYQQALAALAVPLSARAGLHWGAVILRQNSADDVARGAKPLEVDGLAKPIAARVMALAGGGQLLLSADAHAELGAGAPATCSHGHWILKGIADPVEIFEAAAAGASFATPPDADKAYRVVRSGERWIPTREIPNNLPQQVTSFIGREREVDEIKSRLESARLLTLLGMGGLGKTRLSQQVAAEVAPQYPDGVWFIDLAPVRDAALVAGEVAQVLGLREESGRPLVQILAAWLKTRRMLFVFDNCEHLVKPAADLANALLRAAPQVRIIATSREALRVPGEQAYPVLPLPLPGRGDGVAALSQSTAVRLFVERARQHKASFTLGEREAPLVAEIVARLEGIPLALELAAARMRALSLADINSRLSDRYKILTGGGRVLLERQQTLRALVDWSYDLLDEAERALLARLGVFAGGFDLEGAEAVCGADPLAPEDVLDLVGSLVEKSLVILDESEAATRYRMLETIRDYAHEKLVQSGELEATRLRHCEHFLGLAKAANGGLLGPEHAEWVWRLEAEIDNLRAATALALAGGTNRVVAVKFAVALQGFWIARGYTGEGRGVIRAALALDEVRASDRAHAHALYVGAALAQSQGEHAEARRMLETCLAVRRQLDDDFDIAATLSTLSMALLPAGEVALARASEQEALAIFRCIGEAVCEAIGLLHLGQIEIWGGDDAKAHEYLDGCLELSRRIGQQEVEGECELALGEIAFEAGDARRAREHLLRSLKVCREAGDTRGEARTTAWLARADLHEAELDGARHRLEGALQAFVDFEMREDLLSSLEDRAALAAAEDRRELAVRLAAAVEGARKRLGLVRAPRAGRRWQARLDALRAMLAAPDFEAAWAEGEPWDLREAVRHGRQPADEKAALAA